MGDDPDAKAARQAPLGASEDGYWLWYVKVPGASLTPLGVYDHPPDPDVPLLRGIHIGDNVPASILRKATGAVNWADEQLQSLVPFP